MRIAIAGLGSIGRRHLRVATRCFPGLETIAVRSGFGGVIPEEDQLTCTVSDANEAVALKPDVAIIASPAPFHIDQALAFLGAGIPVLIEKPLAVTLHDGERLVQSDVAQSNAFARSAVGYVLRHQPAFDAVLEVFKRRRLGALRSTRIEAYSYLPEWRPGQDFRGTVSASLELGGGVLRELSHEIDYASVLCGRVTSVIGWRNSRTSLDVDVDEHVEFMLRHDGDHITSLSLDFGTRGPTKRCMRAVFDDGSLEWDLKLGWVKIDGWKHPNSYRTYQVERDEMFALQLCDFVDAGMKKLRPKCTIDDGLQVLHVMEAVERSFVSGTWERVS